MRPKILVPMLTICLITVPMVIMSIRMNAFWINSRYDYPFVLVPAFILGDPFLLPVLNYHIYLALTQVVPLLRRCTIIVTVFGCFVLSTIFNSYTHYVWSHDSFTGVIDLQYGTMSVAGWWHYYVSILQIAFAFVFGALWLQTLGKQNNHVFKMFERTLYILIMFSSVNATGAFVGKHLTPNLVLTNFIGSSIPLLVEIVFLLYVRKKYQLIQIKPVSG